MAGLTEFAKKVVGNYQQELAKTHNTGIGEAYSVTPQKEQILIQKMTVLDYIGWFLQLLEMPMVQRKTGEKVLLSLSGASGSRTNTKLPGHKRTPKNFANLENRDYALHNFDNDFKHEYDDYNTWAYLQNFPVFYQTLILMSVAESIIISGWHGITAADETDIATYPLLQDLSKGWLQILREFNSGSQWAKGATAACTFTDAGDIVTIANHGRSNGDVVSFTVITTTTGIAVDTEYYVVGATQNTFQLSNTKGGAAIALTTDGTGTCKFYFTIGQTDYENLDVIVTNAKNAIPIWLRRNLVCYISDNLAAREESQYYKQTVDRASEKQIILQNGGQILKTYGGLQCFVPPYFPDNTILIAPVGGLQFYTETGSIRRTFRDQPEDNGYQDFNQRVAGHVVYNEEQCYLVEDLR